MKRCPIVFVQEQQLQEKEAEQQRWWKKMFQGQMPAQGQGHHQSSFLQQQLSPLVNSNTAVKTKKASPAAAASKFSLIYFLHLIIMQQ
jgi:hypothetical protein